MPAASSYRPADIRNIVLLGHAGSGKTTLAEAILHRCGIITRMGSVPDANTIADFEPEAKLHKHSTSSTLLFTAFAGKEINLIDTPGYPDFIGQALATLPAVETAVILVSTDAGIENNTRRLYHAAGEMGLARMFVINKIDKNPDGLESLVQSLKQTFGPELHCINLPADYARNVIDCFDEDHGKSDFGDVKEIHREMVESVVEVDDAEMEKYLAGESIPLDELRQCFIKAMNQNHVVPILFAAAKNEVGVDDLLHILAEDTPSPLTAKAKRLHNTDSNTTLEFPCDSDKPFLGHIFKVTTDPYVGKLAMIRILQGKMDSNTLFIAGTDKKSHKTGHILKVEGRDHPEMSATAYAGDIVALAKVEELHVDSIIHDPAAPNHFAPILPHYPAPMFSLAIEPKSRGDESKISGALHKLSEEDPTFHHTHDTQTHEIVIHGIGDLHLRIILEKMKNRFNLDVITHPPKIAYRETITAKAEGHYRHKKQTGGAGQFGEVYLRVEPLDRGAGFEFVNDISGGAIPSQYLPSIEKGVHDLLTSGAVAGFPVQDIKVIVYDGKYHPVDSKDIAFRTAGKFALRDAIQKARPALLEPMANLEITLPESHLGDVTADLNTRRARIIAVESQSPDTALIRAAAPLAEVTTYSSQLRSITSGQGAFTMEFASYEVVPPHVQSKLTAAYKPADDVD